MNNKTEKIWKEFQAKLRQFILKRVLDKDVAEDILQEVSVKIFYKILKNFFKNITLNLIEIISNKQLINLAQNLQPCK